MLQKLLTLLIFLCGICCAVYAQQRNFTSVHLTFEKEQAIDEDSVFQSLNSIRHEDNTRASSGYYSGMLSTLFTSKTQSVPIAVNKGDYLILEAYAHFEKAGNKKLLRNLAVAIAAGMAASQLNKAVLKGEGKEMKAIDKLVPVGIGSAIAISSLARQLKGKPKAALSWQLYNQDRQLISKGSIDVSPEAKNNWQYINQPIEIITDGYIILSLANDSKTPVWFDDVVLKKAYREEIALNRDSDQSFSRVAILSMTNNMDAGCGEDDDDCPCRPTVLDPCPCGSDDDDDPCDSDPFSCDCDPSYCEEDACMTNPYSCSCDSYASSHPMECSNLDPCATDPNSCLCNPANCNDDDPPCWTNPYSCECDPAYCNSDPCYTNPFSCECDPMYCQPCTTCDCNPAFCSPCTTCDCNPAYCQPDNNPQTPCGITSASITVNGEQTPGRQINITATPNRVGNPIINAYNFEIFYGGAWYDFEDVGTGNPQIAWLTKVLGNMKFRVRIDYTCNEIDRSITSNEVSFRTSFCRQDLIERFSTAMNTCWTNTVNASLPNSGQHEFGFYSIFTSAQNGGTYSLEDFQANAACGVNVTHEAQNWPAPIGISPFNNGEIWTVGGFHTHPPLTHCPSTNSRPTGPSSIDYGDSDDFPRIVKDYCGSTVVGGHNINLSTCDYNYGPNCTTY